MQKLEHDTGFREKRLFFRRKLPKIAENCDHNFDPRWQEKLSKLTFYVFIFFDDEFHAVNRF
jgi:hypothetical protein